MDPHDIAMFTNSHGLLTPAESKIPARTLRRWCAAGHIVSLLPATYCLPAARQHLTTRIHAVPAWSPDAVLTGSAAARVLFWPQADTRILDIIIRSQCRRPGYAMHRHHVPPEHIVVQDGVQFTDAAWTAVWLADRDGGAALDAALRHGLGVSEMDAALEAMKGFEGNHERRRIVEWSRLRPWSHLERSVHQILVAAGITGWHGNWRWTSPSGRQYVLDIAFPELCLAIEVDGFAFHGGRETWERDMRRANELVCAGWTLLRFCWSDLEHPERIVTQVSAALARLGCIRG